MTLRLKAVKIICWVFVGALAVLSVVRFVRGLGPTTNLTDVSPWGLWIAFDVMCGVALAAGGFVVAAAVHVFHLDRYRSLARPAVLTALIGYVAVAVGLLYDLGNPVAIWHPIIYWNPHSALFEVAVCVMLYLTVLSLEFAPVVLEHPLFDRPFFHTALTALRRLIIPLVIAAVVLSTLHQSSLGSLFLIAPHRVHPLWDSPILPLLFLVSAIGLGLMVVAFESIVAGWLVGHRPRVELLSGLGRAASFVLFGYLSLRVGDMVIRGVLPNELGVSWHSWLFAVELLLSAAIPAVLLSVPAIRQSVIGVGVCAIITIVGVILHRIDICIVTFTRPAALPYFPTMLEVFVTLGIVSGAILVFLFVVERFRVYEGVAATFNLRLSIPFAVAFFVGAALVGWSLPREITRGDQLVRTPVSAPETWSVPSLYEEGEVDEFLIIDGNRNGRDVVFDHVFHSTSEEVFEDVEGEQCGLCHHAQRPDDEQTACHICHSDMFLPTSMEKADASGYKDAMHGLCKRCHGFDEEESREFPCLDFPDCEMCHAQ